MHYFNEDQNGVNCNNIIYYGCVEKASVRNKETMKVKEYPPATP
jgi:hypothetical protein